MMETDGERQLMKGFHGPLFRIMLVAATTALLVSSCGNQDTAPEAEQPQAPAAESAAPAAVEERPVGEANGYRYNPEGRKDPFRSLLVQEKTEKAITTADLPPLQRHGVEEFNLTGITWYNGDAMALVMAPDGKGYILKPGSLMGPNEGIVKKITPSHVEVHEKMTDYKGKATTRVVTLELHRAEEGKK